MSFVKLSLASAVLLLLPQAGHAQVTALTAPDGFEQRVDRYFQESLESGAYGVIHVSVAGETVVQAGYGFADEEAGIGIDGDTIFDIGSLTKQFTAAAILVLAERGALHLSDPLSTYFPDAPDDKASITLLQLITHWSGLSDETGGFEGSDRDPYISRDDFIDALFASPLNHAPGEAYEYSNAGYTVLAAVIEDVSGQEYESFLRQAVLAPAGMANTGYRQLDWTRDQAATGYYWGTPDPARATVGTFLTRWDEEPVSWRLLGNGGLHSTANDLERWHRALQDGVLFGGETLETYEAGYSPYRNQTSALYGFGWVVRPGPTGTPLMSHAGANGVFSATIQRFPEDDVLIVHMSNNSYLAVEDMGSQVRQMLFDPGYAPPPVPPSPIAAAVRFTETRSPDEVAAFAGYFEAVTGEALRDRRVLNRVGLYLASEGEAEWSVALLRLNTELFPGDGNLHDSLGEALFMAGDYAEAERAFRTALDLAPQDGGCGWCENARNRLTEIEAQAR